MIVVPPVDFQDNLTRSGMDSNWSSGRGYDPAFFAWAFIFFHRSFAAFDILALAAAERLPTLRTSFSTVLPNAEAAARTLLN
jgi:hypothetical protein